MKTTAIKYAFMGALALSVTACSIDIDPVSTPSELTEGTSTDTTTAVLKDRDAAVSLRTSIYEIFRNRQEHMHLDNLLFGDVHADNAYAGTTGAEVVNVENNSLDPSNIDLRRDWDRYLEDIAKANVLVNGVEQLHERGLVADADYKHWTAEGRFFRALDMFRMVRMWGSLPVSTKIAEQITYDNVEEVYPTYYPPRSTQEECYRQIIADLEYAADNGPEFDPSDRTVMSRTAAQALLCKVYAEKAVRDYDKVIAYAEKVRATAGIQLEPDFATLWAYDQTRQDCAKRNTSEGILEVHWTAGAGNWEVMMFGRREEAAKTNRDQDFTWAKWITPSRDLVKAYEEEGDTLRYHNTVAWYDCTWSNYYPASNYAFMYKYRSDRSNQYYLRLADILLLEAEAYAFKGDVQRSAQLVNLIRTRAKLPALTAARTASPEAMQDAVLRERRLELALEGERWFDLCRYGKVETVMNGLNLRDSGRLPQRRVFDANSYLLPIPQQALDQNTNLQQNPGY